MGHLLSDPRSNDIYTQPRIFSGPTQNTTCHIPICITQCVHHDRGLLMVIWRFLPLSFTAARSPWICSVAAVVMWLSHK